MFINKPKFTHLSINIIFGKFLLEKKITENKYNKHKTLFFH